MVAGGDGELGDRLAVKFGLLLAHLNERSRRLYLGSEALALEGELGRERAVALVAGAAGVSLGTVRAGAEELTALPPSESPAQTRHRVTRQHQK
jgi:hypothetical protein